MKNRKAPGADAISAEVLIAGGDEMTKFLLNTNLQILIDIRLLEYPQNSLKRSPMDFSSSNLQGLCRY